MNKGKAFTQRDIERVTAQMQAGRASDAGRDDVRHICPECGGGPATNTQSGLILVQTCPACGGEGTMSDDRLTMYLRTQS